MIALTIFSIFGLFGATIYGIAIKEPEWIDNVIKYQDKYNIDKDK
jgi:hypothetical protein